MTQTASGFAAVRIEQLVAHQDGVLVIINRILALLTDPLGDCAAIGRHRWELVRTIRAYQLFKHWRIFDPAIASGVRWQVERGTAMKRACIETGEDFKAHVLAWSSTDVAAHWQDYRQDMLLWSQRLIRHMEVERQDGTILLQAVPAVRPVQPAPKLRRSPLTRPLVRSARAASPR